MSHRVVDLSREAPLTTLGRHAHQAFLERRPDELGVPGPSAFWHHNRPLHCSQANRENALIDALYEVSEPGHPRYRAHLTKEQVADLVAPRPETLELVNSWLEHHGISSSSVSMTHGGNTLKLKGVSVTQANTLLGASALHWHVLTVAPTTSFVSPRTQWQTPRNHSSGETVGTSEVCIGRARDDAIEPRKSRLRHTVLPALAVQHGGLYTQCDGRECAQGLGFSGDSPSPADLSAFMRKYSEADDATYKVVKINGGSTLKPWPIQLPTSSTSVGRGPLGTDDYYVTWLEYILDRRDIPQTISISYGYKERHTSREYALYVCNMFAMLGSLGVSVLVPSGNDGIGEGTCVNWDGMVRFIPEFPAPYTSAGPGSSPHHHAFSGPWVIVVGGTTDYVPEVAAKFSGGGFSDLFERPLYQRRAVPTFLENLGSRYQGLYNASGRGIPDIAAQSINLPIFFNGQEKRVEGTSGATPAGTARLPQPLAVRKGPRSSQRHHRGLESGRRLDGDSLLSRVTGLGTPNFRRMMGQLS
ncbi:subtilisin-like protein [Lactarius hengduanensis]|nr:subtilisin-like protein [Lactarius hengduanensis]